MSPYVLVICFFVPFGPLAGCTSLEMASREECMRAVDELKDHKATWVNYCFRRDSKK